VIVVSSVARSGLSELAELIWEMLSRKPEPGWRE